MLTGNMLRKQVKIYTKVMIGSFVNNHDYYYQLAKHYVNQKPIHETDYTEGFHVCHIQYMHMN